MSKKVLTLNAQRGLGEAALFALCSFVATGCSGCFDISFDFGFPATDGGYYDGYDDGPDSGLCDLPRNDLEGVDSDGKRLRGFITCEAGIDCSVQSRDVLRGTTLRYRIPISADRLTTETSLESSDPERLELTFDGLALGCDGFELIATAHFKELGEAAIIMRDGTREIDRFTTTTHDLARLELVVPSDDTDGGVDDDIALEAITLEEPLRVELVLRSETGAALTGGAEAQWFILSPNIASFDDEAIGPARERLLVPLQAGQTLLRIRSNGQFLILGVHVPGVEDDSDGGRAL